MIRKNKDKRNLYLLYGEDSYRAEEKLQLIRQKYLAASPGSLNLALIDFGLAAIDFAEFVRQVTTLPFLGTKRLVIVKDCLSVLARPSRDRSQASAETASKIAEFLVKIPSSTVVVFVEREDFDRRSALFRKLNQPGQSQEFLPLGEPEISQWISAEVKNRGGKIEPEGLRLLARFIGNDLWRASNEIDKLLAYHPSITSQSVQLLVRPRPEIEEFDLSNAVASRDTPKILGILSERQKQGQHPLELFGMIASQLKSLLLVRDLLDRQIPPVNIAKELGYSPGRVWILSRLAQGFTLTELKKAYQMLALYDWQIKSGRIEPEVALDLLVLKMFV